MKCTGCKRDVETVVHHHEHRWCAGCYSNRLAGESPATIKAQRIRDAERAAVEAAERAYDECHCYDEWTCEACKAMGVAIRALQEARK